jgi:hypothetical protein
VGGSLVGVGVVLGWWWLEVIRWCSGGEVLMWWSCVSGFCTILDSLTIF